MITRSRKRQKQAEEDGTSPNDPRTVTAVPDKNGQQKRFWLDTMSVEIRAHIAKFVTRGGKPTDAALNLAHTSELQRRAVLECMPREPHFFVEMTQLSKAWVELLADHFRALSLMVFFPGFRRKIASEHYALFLPLLRGERLEKVSIPPVKPFLDGLRDATALRELDLKMHNCSRRPLLAMLRRRGPSLSHLILECGESNEATSSPPSNDCPMSLCSNNGPTALTSLP